MALGYRGQADACSTTLHILGEVDGEVEKHLSSLDIMGSYLGSNIHLSAYDTYLQG